MIGLRVNLLTAVLMISSVSVTTVTGNFSPKNVPIDTYCDLSKPQLDYVLEENKDILIRMTSSSPQQKGNYNCSMSVVSSSLGGVSLRGKFINFQASEKRDNFCSQGAIQIFDFTGKAVRTPYCESAAPVATYDLGKRGIVDVYNQNWTKGDRITFDLLISPVTIKSAVSSECPPDYFDCQEDKKTCVHNDLKCNGYEDCEDGRDERVCGTGGISDVAVAFIILTIIFAAGAVSAAIVMRRRGRGRGFTNLDGATETTRVLN